MFAAEFAPVEPVEIITLVTTAPAGSTTEAEFVEDTATFAVVADALAIKKGVDITIEPAAAVRV
jgi:hypothetical protein